MSQKQRYKEIPQQYFEDFLDGTSIWAEYDDEHYQYDWIYKDGRWIEENGVINEYCYFLDVFTNKICLKIYSSIRRDINISRGVGRDAIRVVVADAQTGKPIRPAFPIVKRLPMWRPNLRRRISDALRSVGVDVKCVCGKTLFLKCNRETGNRFLACETHPKCKYNRDFQ